MEIRIVQRAGNNQAFIIDDIQKAASVAGLSKEEASFVSATFGNDQSFVTINRYKGFAFIILMKPKKTDWQTAESLRKSGAELQAVCNKYKIQDITITNASGLANAGLLVAEGTALANYQFLKYRTEAKKLANSLQKISFTKDTSTVKDATQLQITVDAIYKARTLVNEPLNSLSAVQLAREIAAMGKAAGFKVTTLTKPQIVKEKMGGLLAVNRGSIQPPTFSVMEYVPRKPLNKKPIVLVGKGIVYDTGGLSLKPTANSMDKMKSDMSGAALVSSTMYAIAKLQLPLHVIALVPATDNRPGQEAYTPGDVITMYSGATVEVLNTDAEGRMILADALHWAKRYKPELVLDFATLTGAASAAVGEHGIVCMGTAPEQTKQAFASSGFRQYERLVEYPLWDEYGDQIKSDVADIKNVGGATGGAITAGKFLQHFTDYPWMHFDIAGVSFFSGKKGYHTTGGTGYGIKMLLDFLTNYGKG
ncbi:MAG: leucyl aminopeptidase [Taibaiella sp.]|nr:leucyl aminopeptidase [Taibaiella sp.]